MALAGWRERSLAGREALRPVPAESLHLTLAFLGHRPEEEIPRIAKTAFAAAAGLGPARLRAREARPVPARRPRLVALDLEDAGAGAAAIQAAVAAALARAGLFAPERRAFWPHVTVARVRAGRSPGHLGDLPRPPEEAFEASEVTLYRSTLRREGARYDALDRIRLGAS